MIEEIKELIEAQNAKDKCYADCGVDPGYFCYNEVNRLNDAEESLSAAIDNLIDQRLIKRGLLEKPND